MGKVIIAFGNIEVEKRKFHQRKNIVLLEEVDAENIQVFRIVSSGEKLKRSYWLQR